MFYIKATDIKNQMGMEIGSDLFEVTKKNFEGELHRLLNTFAFGDIGNPNHSFPTIPVFSEPLQAIKIIVEDKDIELIMMGTRGQTNARSKIYGSTATDVMEKIVICPVIVIPQLAKRELPKEWYFQQVLKPLLKSAN